MRPLSRQTSHGRMIHETLTRNGTAFTRSVSAPAGRQHRRSVGHEAILAPPAQACRRDVHFDIRCNTPIATGAYAAVGAVLAEQTCAETSFCRAA
jgi:hypothetical protein